jgi:glutamate 5-kinase
MRDRKIVVKVGSSVIAPEGKLSSLRIRKLVEDIIEAEKKGYKAIIVSSGAVICGLNKLGYKSKPQDIHSLMALSSLGQIILMGIYGEKFKKYKKLCAQILLTWDDFDNRKRFLNAKKTINKLLNLGIMPIINENDAVSFEEIRFGDNDRLSALVADLVGAEMLIILSDVDGVIEKGKVIEVIHKIDSKTFSLVKKKNSSFTSGGMLTKLEASKITISSGIKTVIANGKVENVISRILEGERIGTLFLPTKKIEEARKRWIAFGKKIKGKIYIDDGAKEAILNRGKSLLSVGIIKIEGDFKRRDAVEILDKNGIICGRGLVNYSSEELSEFKKKKFEREIIHRNDFVKSEE